VGDDELVGRFFLLKTACLRTCRQPAHCRGMGVFEVEGALGAAMLRRAGCGWWALRRVFAGTVVE